MKSVPEIMVLAAEREAAAGTRHQVMREVRDTYDGDVVLPLPELEEHEVAAVANQLQTGLDGTAQRASSTQADVYFPSSRAGYKSHDDRAREQRKAALGWWERNAMEIRDARRYRHFFGYATSPVLLRPDRRWGFARWEVRDPLESYPAPSADPDDVVVDDVVFCYRRSLGWVRKHYGAAAAFVPRPNRTGRGGSPDGASVKVIEYVDDTECVLVATGTSDGTPVGSDWSAAPIHIVASGQGFGWGVELERYANRAGLCTASIPGRITLAGPIGQFDALPGMHYKQAKLDALEYRAIEEGIFPKLWLVSHPNSQRKAKVITVADGRRGILGEIEDGSIVNVNPQPSYLAYQAQDRLERSARIGGGVPAQMSGENPTNVRTGRASDMLLSSAVDHGIAEAQRVMARSKAHELEIAVAVAKGWHPSRPVSFHVNWKGAKGPVSYTAADLFPDGSPPPQVHYSLAGADAARIPIELGQRLGTGEISMHTARRLDPMVEDPEFEDDQTTVESLRTALLSGIQNLAATDPSFTEPLARMMQAIRVDKMELAEAYLAEQQRVKEQQATSGPPGAPDGPVDPASPEAQPGLGVPGGAAEVGVSIPEPGPSQDRFAQLLNQLRTTRTAGEAAARSASV